MRSFVSCARSIGRTAPGACAHARGAHSNARADHGAQSAHVLKHALFALFVLNACSGVDATHAAVESNEELADPSTLEGKMLVGYQGWFATPNDGSRVGWSHWAPGVTPNR